MIDLRSDTATQPTEGMRAAIAAAVVGDEQKREDPTVNELEARAATLLGQDEAIFVPTATMANQIALRAAHGARGRAGRRGELARVHLGARRSRRALGGHHARASRCCRPVQRRAGARGPPRASDPFASDACCLGREHAQCERRTDLAARGDRRAPQPLRRARPPFPSRRRAAAERGDRQRGGRRDDRPALRLGDALSLQGSRLPARRAPGRLGRGDAERAPA